MEAVADKTRSLHSYGSTEPVLKNRCFPWQHAGQHPRRADGSMKVLSNLDLTQELTAMIPTKHGYEAAQKSNDDLLHALASPDNSCSVRFAPGATAYTISYNSNRAHHKEESPSAARRSINQ